MKEEFVLPEKWCIKITKDNLKLVGDYYNRKGSDTYTDKYNIGIYYSSHNLSSGDSIMGERFGANFIFNGPVDKPEYIEIDTELFVLKVLNNTYTPKPLIKENLSYLIELLKNISL